MKEVLKAFKSILTFFFGTTPENMRMDRLINADIISFDMYDTLVTRDCINAKDVFFETEERLTNLCPHKCVHGFAEARILAERKALSSVGMENITYDDIYSSIEGFDEEIINLAKKIELDIELNITSPNVELLKIYNYLIEHNKEVLIVSDMYLEPSFLVEILVKNGIMGYKKLYVSSAERATKRNGKMFELIRQSEKLYNKKWVHIGDHLMSDFIIPQKKQIKSILVR